MIKKSLLGCLWAVVLPFGLVWASDNIKSTDNVSVELFNNGQDEYIARFEINNGWHIYWSNPGEIGKPTTIEILPTQNRLTLLGKSKPVAVKALEVIDEYIYQNQAYFYFRADKSNNAKLIFSYVECSDECKTQKLSFDLSTITPSTPTVWQYQTEQMQQTLPQSLNVVSPTERNLITLDMPSELITHFVPTTSDIVDIESIKTEQKGKLTQISWKNLTDKKLTEALVITPNKTYSLNITYDNTVGSGLWYILLLAFLGGIILNAMPCVFPILSLKIFSLIQLQNHPRRGSRALLYVLGVLICFWILTTILVLIKAQGEAIGWGFQLQSPWFVGIMATIFALLFLFMIDVWQFPDISTQKTHQLASINAFTTGFFAVLIASPCTGPFMGVAIGYAFMQSNITIYAVFTALALGYALPYALIELYPNAVAKILPKAGKWMHTVKIVLSIPVLLTSLWLFGVLAIQLNKQNKISTQHELNWQAYDRMQIEDLANRGERVFVDFTADWCLTCKVNDKLILQSNRFKQAVEKHNIHLFKADLTQDNAVYLQALNDYGRDGIPVYVYYRNGSFEILPVFFRVGSLQ